MSFEVESNITLKKPEFEEKTNENDIITVVSISQEPFNGKFGRQCLLKLRNQSGDFMGKYYLNVGEDDRISFTKNNQIGRLVCGLLNQEIKTSDKMKCEYNDLVELFTGLDSAIAKKNGKNQIVLVKE